MKRFLGLFLVLALSFCAAAEAARGRAHLPGDAVVLASGEIYYLTKKLGAGAVSTVFRASRPGGDEAVALKFFSQVNQNFDLFKNILEGFGRAKKMQSSSLLPFRFANLENGELIVVMPVAEQSLLSYLNERHSSAERLKTAQEVFVVLQNFSRELLRQGYHFGDIKPSNIVRYQGQWKIIDFDSVNVIGDVNKIFTSVYAPGEVRRHQKSQWTSDAFSIGRTLTEVLLGNQMPESILDAEKWSQLTLQEIYERYPEFHQAEFQEIRRFLAASLADKHDERATRLSRAGFGNACNKTY